MASPGKTPVTARPKWLVPLLIGVVVVIALVLLLTRCGGEDDDASTPGDSTAATTPAAVPSATVTSATSATSFSATAAGTVTAGNTDLMINSTAAGLKPHDGQQATANAVEVQSVPADEGFWIGSSETDRLWIQLTDTGGESDYQVKAGDQVGFTGTVTKAADGYAATTGLTAAEGADQLTKQGYYLSVPASGVKLSR